MSEPVAPEPDDKDWTWTITDACPDCGYDATAVTRAEVPDRTREYAETLAGAAEAPGSAERPEPAVWSPLEYGAHARDVCRLFTDRLTLMLEQDDPEFPNWDQDETALADRYWEQDPALVASALRTSADVLAHRFATVRFEDWERPGRRSNGSQFTVDTFARYFLHDLAHHAWDVS